jgi:hypothetical protein
VSFLEIECTLKLFGSAFQLDVEDAASSGRPGGDGCFDEIECSVEHVRSHDSCIVPMTVLRNRLKSKFSVQFAALKF